MNHLKKYAVILMLFFFSMTTCKAQVPVYSVTQLYNNTVDGAYYKDIEGNLSHFIGTWKYTYGNEVFKLVIGEKIEHYSTGAFGKKYYEDILYGEYLYVNSEGQQVTNSIGNFNSSIILSEHLIFGNYMSPCNDCNPGQRPVILNIYDPARPYFDYDLILQKPAAFIDEPFIKVMIKNTTDVFTVEEGQPVNNRLPVGREFKLYKVAD